MATMKTPEEIKKGLGCCNNNECVCLNGDTCPYRDYDRCIDLMAGDALAYIRQMEEEIERMKLCVEDLTDKLAAANEEAVELRKLSKKWISVEERLPEAGIQKVLVLASHEHGSITDTARYMGKDGWDLSSWKLYQDCVTHWMPLPEPPEEDKV